MSSALLRSGAITTLGRGGSDLTATVIAAALRLREVNVWKDVAQSRAYDPMEGRRGVGGFVVCMCSCVCMYGCVRVCDMYDMYAMIAMYAIFSGWD